MTSTFTIIKKLVLALIAGASVIALSLPVSFAVDVEPVTSVLEEPVFVNEIVNGQRHLVLNAVITSNWNPTHCLAVLDVYAASSTNFYLYGFGVAADQPFSGTFTRINIVTGDLVSSTQVNRTTPDGSTGYFALQGYYTQGLYPNSYNYGYFINELPFKSSVYTPAPPRNMVEPYVTWSISTPTQTAYTSSLSEPVADQYNSYMVLDDHLVWISYRVNAMYSRSNTIESSSQLYSESTSVISSGNGSFTEVGNGYTEDVSVPDGYFQGHVINPNDLFTGYYAGYDLGNIDFSTVGNGSVSFNSSGTVTYNDVEYYPISFSQNDVLSYFRLYCIPTDSDTFVFWLAPDRSMASDLLVNMDFFFSEFDLDGNYIKSSFHTVTSTDIGLFDSYTSEDQISSIRCYGIDFFNINNLPINLSSVLWQYDMEFKTWRDNTYTRLNQIYNVLSNGEDVPKAETYSNWGNELNEIESNYANVSPVEMNSLLISSFGNGKYDNAALQIKSWISDFSIGELIAVCVFALALGTVTLTLGKKKSE